MFQRPLICTDLSDGLQRLVECVPNLVAGGMTDIVFLHIVLFPEDENIPQADVKRTDRAKERGLIKVQFSALTLALSPRRRVGEGLPHFVRRAEDAHKSYRLFNP